jgi:ankyrin repeat protein
MTGRRRLEEQERDEEERRKVLAWLSPLSFEAKHRQVSELRQGSTGLWFLEHETFIQWKTAQKDLVLWSSGIPGAGKTYMASTVIDNLRLCEKNRSDLPVAFIYADYKDHYQQRALHFLSCITRQLASQIPAFLNCVKSLYKDRQITPVSEEVPLLTFTEQIDLLRKVSNHVSRYFIIIDAVDELPTLDEMICEDVRSDFLQTISKLPSAKIFITSRPHISSKAFFQNALHIPIEASDTDLRTFLEAKISTSKRLGGIVSKDKTLKEQIVQTITAKASGMFLLARLQLEQLMAAITPRQVRMMLEKLSKKLADIYECAIMRIKQQPDIEAKLGMRTIFWIACSRRALTVSEITQALSIESEDESLDEGGIIDIQIILESCAGLIHLQAVSSDLDLEYGPFCNEDTLHFTHHTMQEYMSEGRAGPLSNSHCDIANTCLTYLCFKTFRFGIPNPLNNPFLAYAAPFWPAHTTFVDNGLDYELIGTLISRRYPALSKTWLQFAFRGTFGRAHRNIPPGFAVAAVAKHGASNVLRYLLDKGIPVNVMFRSRWTPLIICIQSRNYACAELIVANGLTNDPNANQVWIKKTYDTYMSEGALDKFYNLMQDHIDPIKSADHDFTKSRTRAPTLPLIADAMLSGERTILRSFLHENWNSYLSDPHSRSSDRKMVSNPQSILIDAVRSGNFQILERLASVGAKLSEILATLLMIAVLQEQEELTQALLQAGADPNSALAYYDLPLVAALKLKNNAVMRILLKGGACLDVSSVSGETPLTLAIINGDKNVIEELLKAGANPDFRCLATDSPLAEAVKQQAIGVVRLLLRAGATVNSSCRRDRTPLTFALRLQNIHIVRRLLKAGAAMKVLPLVIPIEKETENLVQTLLEDQCKVEGTNEPRLFTIFVASQNSTVAQDLLAHGTYVSKAHFYKNYRQQNLTQNPCGPAFAFLLDPGSLEGMPANDFTLTLRSLLDQGLFKVFRQISLPRKIITNVDAKQAELLLVSILGSELDPIPPYWIELAKICGLTTETLLKGAICLGNVQIATHIMYKHRRQFDMHVGFRSPSMTAIKYQRPSLIVVCSSLYTTCHTSLTRLALEWFALNLAIFERQASLKELLNFPTDNVGTEQSFIRVNRAIEIQELFFQIHGHANIKRIYPYEWLTYDRLFRIARLGTKEEFGVLKEAIARGVRPIDFNVYVASGLGGMDLLAEGYWMWKRKDKETERNTEQRIHTCLSDLLPSSMPPKTDWLGDMKRALAISHSGFWQFSERLRSRLCSPSSHEKEQFVDEFVAVLRDADPEIDSGWDTHLMQLGAPIGGLESNKLRPSPKKDIDEMLSWFLEF